MKKFKFLLPIFILSLLFSCSGGIYGGSQNTLTIQINFRRSHMGLFGSPYQGQTLPKRVRIVIDKLKSNYQIESNFRTYVFQRHNTPDAVNCIFSNIEVPQTGSYSITAVILGTSCYTGCFYSNICDHTKGQPRLRKVSIILNAQNTPNVFYIEPIGFAGCL